MHRHFERLRVHILACCRDIQVIAIDVLAHRRVVDAELVITVVRHFFEFKFEAVVFIPGLDI